MPSDEQVILLSRSVEAGSSHGGLGVEPGSSGPVNVKPMMLLGLNEAMDARQAWAALLFTLLVAAVPLWFTTYPPLLDYPGHLARIHILKHWQASPAYQRWYDLHSFILPNVGLEGIVLGLAQLVPTAVAARLFVVLTLVLSLSGCMMLHRHLHGYFSWWPLVSALFLFNGIFLLGFLNYLLGVGLLLWALALWVALSRSAPWARLAGGMVLAVALFFCHLAALGLYAVAVMGYEIQRSATAWRTGGCSAWLGLVVGACIFIIPGLLFLLSATASHGGTAHPPLGVAGVMAPAVGKAEKPLSYVKELLLWRPLKAYRAVFMSGNAMLDHVLFAVSALSLLVMVRHGRLQLAKSMYVPLAMLLLAYLAMPYRVLGVSHADVRLSVAILFVAIGCVRWSSQKAVSRALLGGFVVLLAVRSAVLAYDWQSYNRVTQVFVSAFTELPPHATLFVANAGTSAVDGRKGSFERQFFRPPLRHVAAFATLQRPIFVPTIFANRSQQPMTVTHRYATLYAFQGGNPIRVTSAEHLAAIADRIRHLTVDTDGPAAQVFLLVLYPEIQQLPMPPGTTVMASGPHFLLLAVDGPPADS
jgi:hypothetical protein